MRGSWAFWQYVGILSMGLILACRPSGESLPAPSPKAGAVDLTRLPSVDAAAMAHTCAGCHNQDGPHHGSAFPQLAGMPAGQFVRSMKGFRSGRRPATLMGLVARGFTDRDDQAMGDHFARMAPRPLQGERP